MKIYIMIILVFIWLIAPAVFAADEGISSGRISLDLKGMDIMDVLKLLSQKSDLNIVAGKNVKGTVTIYLRDVDVMDALEIILASNDLAYERDGNLIKVMTEREYEQIYGRRFSDRTDIKIVKLDYANAQDVSKALNQIKTNVGRIVVDERSNTIVLIDVPESLKKMQAMIREMDTPSFTEVFSLNYAKAEDIKPHIEGVITKDSGSFKVDTRTNKIVVRDTPEKLEYIKKMVEAFDEKPRQVLIEGKIVQVTLSDKYGHGIDWSSIFSFGDVRGVVDVDLSTGLTGLNTFTVSTLKGGDSAILRFLETYGTTDILSSPRITVANNQEAKILVGTKEVFVTSTITTTQGGTYSTADNVQFVDVGVNLTVTPSINKEGFINMKIKPEVSSAPATDAVILKNPDGSTRSQIPKVTTSEAETTVLIRDSTTIMIGGLMKDTDTDRIDKVPILGDVPLVGGLFRSKGVSKEKTELVIFITPHIVTGDVPTEELNEYLTSTGKLTDEIQ